MTTGEGAAGQGGNGQPAGTAEAEAEAEALTPQQRDRKRADAVYDSEVETPDHDLAGLLSDAAKAQGVNIRWTDPGEDAAGVMGMQSAREPNTVYVAADALRRKIGERFGWSCSVPEYRDEVALD